MWLSLKPVVGELVWSGCSFSLPTMYWPKGWAVGLEIVELEFDMVKTCMRSRQAV